MKFHVLPLSGTDFNYFGNISSFFKKHVQKTLQKNSIWYKSTIKLIIANHQWCIKRETFTQKCVIYVTASGDRSAQAN